MVQFWNGRAKNGHSKSGQKVRYSGGLNTKHWNTEQIGIQNVLKFCFPVVQKKLLYIKWSRLVTSFVFQWSGTLENGTKRRPFCQPLEKRAQLENRIDPYHSNSKHIQIPFVKRSKIYLNH